MSQPQQPRTRRRHGHVVARAAVSAAALAVALAIAVPAVLSTLGGSAAGGGEGGGPGGPAGGAPGDTGRGTDWVPDGWRVESFRHLTWAVPGTWGHGTIDQWCADDGGTRGAARPVVQRPYGASTLVGCFPARGLGLQVTVGVPAPPTDASEYVEGAAVAQERFGDVTLTVSTHDAALSAQVLDTAHVFDETDPLGCPATADPVPLGRDAVAGPTAGRLSVCRYTLPPPGSEAGALLDQSELLSAVDSAQAWTALEEAPAGTGPDAGAEDCSGWDAEQVVLLRTSAGEVAWVHYDGCAGHGVQLLGHGARRLTVDVLRWAFTPGWSGGVDGSVPMPASLRRPTY